MSETTTTTTPDYSQTGTALPDAATLAEIISAVNGLKTAVANVTGLSAEQESALSHVVTFFG